MKKIGMVNTKQNFDHPKLAKGHELERHCLYRITQQQWRESNKL
jgi:RimJ/RimL family protein N-acetyltransferase